MDPSKTPMQTPAFMMYFYCCDLRKVDPRKLEPKEWTFLLHEKNSIKLKQFVACAVYKRLRFFLKVQFKLKPKREKVDIRCQITLAQFEEKQIFGSLVRIHDGLLENS